MYVLRQKILSTKTVLYTPNIMKMEKADLHKEVTCLDMSRCESSQQPRFLTCVLAVFESCPTEIAHGCNLHNCWRVPIKVNSVLLSFIISLSFIIHSLTFPMQHPIVLIAAICDAPQYGLKLKQCASSA